MVKVPSVLLRSVAVLFVFFGAAQGSTVTSAASGEWNAPSTWSGGVVPSSGDDVFIGVGHTITLTVTDTCGTISFSSSSSGTATGYIAINSGCTLFVSSTLNCPGYNTAIKNTCTYVISGGGRLSCGSMNIGNPLTPGGSATSTIALTSTVSALVIRGNLTLEGGYNGVKINNPTLDIQSGSFRLGGAIVTRDVNNPTAANIYTVTTENGAQSSSITLLGSAPWNLAPAAGVNNILLAGTNVTVNYAGIGAQEVLATRYTNLELTGSGSKTVLVSNSASIAGTTSGTVAVSGSYLQDAAITSSTVAPAYTRSPSIAYRGTTALTTGAELPDTVAVLTIDNTAGVTLGKSVTVATLTIGRATPNSVLNDGGHQISSSGTLNLVSGTLNLGAKGLTSFPGFTSVNLNPGTTIGYTGEGAQKVSTSAIYENLTLGGSGSKSIEAISVNGTLRMEASTTTKGTPVFFGDAAMIEYCGSTAQTTGSELLDKGPGVIIENPDGVLLGSSPTISSLVFRKGNLSLGDNDLTIASSGSISGAGSSSYVITGSTGYLTQEVPSSNTEVSFPVGTAKSYNPVVLNNVEGKADSYSVRVESGSAKVEDVSRTINTYWTIKEGVDGGSNIRMTLQWSGDEEGTTFSTDRTSGHIARYAAREASWTPAKAKISGSSPYVAQTAQNLTGEGIFQSSVYTVQVASPLPVQLAGFVGAVQESGVVLHWNTLSEMNNYGFLVQRSEDAHQGYTTVSPLIPGHGTTTTGFSYAFTDEGVSTGFHYYRLIQTDLDGTTHQTEAIMVGTTTDITGREAVPAVYSLSRNYPNPFNPSTTIRCDLPVAGKLRVAICDILGREVVVLMNEWKPAGSHDLRWDASKFSSGTYLCRMESGDPSTGPGQSFFQTRRMMLVK
jgi:hypothetical protein